MFQRPLIVVLVLLVAVVALFLEYGLTVDSEAEAPLPLPELPVQLENGPPGVGLQSPLGDSSQVASSERLPETTTAPRDAVGTSPSPDPRADEVEFSRRKLVASMELFRADRSLTNAQNLMQRTVVAWADLSGTAEHYGPDDPVPEQELTEEVWSIWVTNRFGSKLVKYTRAEFPEYFEIRDLPRAGQSIFDLELDEDILRRVEQRAQTVLDLLGED